MREYRGVWLDDDGRVAEVVPCSQCGYNLRTQPIDGRCSECGVEVRPSLRSSRLRFADVEWLWQVHAGVGSLLVAIALAVGFGVLAILTSPCLFIAAFGGFGITTLGGVVLLTSRDPGWVPQRRHSRTRGAIRSALLALLVLPVCWAAGPPIGNVAMLVWGGIAFVLIAALVFLYLGELMARIPEETLAFECRLQAVLLPAFVVLIPLAAIGAVLIVGAGQTGPVALFTTLICAGAPGVVILGSATATLAHVCRRLRGVVEEASAQERSEQTAPARDATPEGATGEANR